MIRYGGVLSDDFKWTAIIICLVNPTMTELIFDLPLVVVWLPAH